MTNYIRLRTTLPSSPKVMLIARELDCSLDEALGVMVRWLAWLDMHTTDGKTGLSLAEVDSLVFGNACQEYSKALVAIGWAEVVDGKVCATDFDKYCTPTAKSRISACERQRKLRSKKGGAA